MIVNVTHLIHVCMMLSYLPNSSAIPIVSTPTSTNSISYSFSLSTTIGTAGLHADPVVGCPMLAICSL